MYMKYQNNFVLIWLIKNLLRTLVQPSQKPGRWVPLIHWISSFTRKIQVLLSLYTRKVNFYKKLGSLLGQKRIQSEIWFHFLLLLKSANNDNFLCYFPNKMSYIRNEHTQVRSVIFLTFFILYLFSIIVCLSFLSHTPHTFPPCHTCTCIYSLKYSPFPGPM